LRKESIRMSPEVQRALGNGEPVVALETTIIAHGMPYPTNLETALAVEEIVRANGATPATVGIIGGELTVGMTEEQIRFFATGTDILKVVERDIPLVVAQRRHAATTVGSSLAIAASAGILVFVTGGIGAVAPHAGTTFDISADLLAIASYPCLTVCAGAKAFMDIAATLEFLETHSVPVIVYRSEYFPLFYSRGSGRKVEWTADSAEEIAAAFAAQLGLGIERGMLVGVPVPEEDALPAEVAQAAIEVALEKARLADVTGKEVTPFVLSAIKEETAGKSLAANVALVKNNAEVGARIAVALAERSR
jgi:pseudouridine-5'-phosphate glycosidase